MDNRFNVHGNPRKKSNDKKAGQGKATISNAKRTR
jgi:hypothetical protein